MRSRRQYLERIGKRRQEREEEREYGGRWQSERQERQEYSASAGRSGGTLAAATRFRVPRRKAAGAENRWAVASARWSRQGKPAAQPDGPKRRLSPLRCWANIKRGRWSGTLPLATGCSGCHAMGGDALLEVAFDGIGTKKLMLKAAAQHYGKTIRE